MQTESSVPASPILNQKGYGSRGYMGYVLLLMFFVYGLYGMHRMVMGLLVEPIKGDLHLSDSQMGIIIGPAFSLCFAIAGVPFGLLADRVNRRNMVAALIAAWSVATGLGGMAQSFIQMAISRAAVGMGIAGGPPACMAMITDIFPSNWRTTALSVFYMGGAIGGAAAFGAGAWSVAHFGWRNTLWLAAVPGLVLAMLIYFTVREPLRGLSDGRQNDTQHVSVKQTFGFIIRQSAVVQITLGLIFLHMVGHGLMNFMSSFLIRTHNVSLSEAGGTISMLYFITAPISQIAAGFLADFLGRFDVRWRLRLGLLGSILSALALCTMTIVQSSSAAAVCFAVWSLSSGLFQAPLYALLLSLVKPKMRATMASIQFVLTAAIGGALGPLFVGMVSDFLRPEYGADSLRYALFLLGFFYLWASMHFVFGERSLKRDLALAEQA